MSDRIVQFLIGLLSQKFVTWLSTALGISLMDIEGPMKAMITGGVTIVFLIVKGYQDRNKGVPMTPKMIEAQTAAQREAFNQHIKSKLVEKALNTQNLKEQMEIYGVI